MRSANIICNVGGILFNGESTYWVAFLAKMDDGQYFITIRKPAATINTVAFAAGFGLISKENLLANSSNNIPASVIALLALGTESNFSNELDAYGRFKAAVFTETTILALTSTVYGLTALASCPPMYSIKGANVAQEVVTQLAGTDDLTPPVNTGTNTGGVIIPVSNANTLPELQDDPLGAVKALFGNTTAYLKANPISTGFIGLGVIEAGSALGLWKFSVLKSLGIIKKGRK